MDHINLEGVILELREAMKRITELEARVKAVEDEANARVNTVKDEANARVKTVEDEANARVKAIEDEANSRVKAIEDEANSRIKAAEKSATEANHKLQCIMYVREILAERQMYYHQTGSCRQNIRVNY